MSAEAWDAQVSEEISDSLRTFEQRVVGPVDAGRTISRTTFNRYRPWIERFEHFVGTTEPEVGDVIDFDNYLADPESTQYPWPDRGRPQPDAYAYRTRTVAASAIKLWLRVHYDRNVTERPKDIVQGEPEPFDPKYLDRDAVLECIEAAGDCLDGCRAALAVSYDAIMRASELVQVRREDVDFENGTLYVRATKGSLNATLGLADSTLEYLRDHWQRHPDREYPFRNSYGRKWQPSAWVNHFRENHHEVGSHSWGRHTPIVHRLSDGSVLDADPGSESFGEVYQRARHSNPGMTSRYARLIDADVPEWAREE